MLREFITRQQTVGLSPTGLDEHLRRTAGVFDECVDFLRDPHRFPNSEINIVTTLMWRLIGNKEIPIGLDQLGTTMSFAVGGRGIEQSPLFIVPNDFINQVSSDPVFQLGMIAFMASQARDYYTGRVKQGGSGDINRRARGYEAEALLTLLTMAQQEGVDLNLTAYQLRILEENPEGLKSLPRGLVYETPVYI